MLDLPNIGKTTATDDDYRPRQTRPAIDLVFHWALRLALPVVILLSGLVLYWIWFEPGKSNWLQIAGTFPLVVNIVLVAIWAACTWE